MADRTNELHATNAEVEALRRLATLVAQGAPAAEVYSAASNEVATLFDAEIAFIGRFEPTDPPEITAVGVSEGPLDELMRVRAPLMDWLASTTVHRTGRTARKEVTAEQITGSGPLSNTVRAMGFFSTVSAPIVVEGSLWGVVTASSSRESLRADTERRIESFGELVASAIANTQSRGDLATSEARARALAQEQAALRRVATLVAGTPSSDELFSAVAREVANVLNVPGVLVERFESAATVVTFGVAYDSRLTDPESFFRVGTRWPLDPGCLAAQVFETHRMARVDDYLRLDGTVSEAARAAGLGSGVAGPILVDGELWGQMCVFSKVGTVLPIGTEDRLHDFIELVATAISNHEARAGLRTLADEQAALRRVATLVAEDAPSGELFRLVTHEVGTLLDADFAGLARFEESAILPLAVWAADGEHPPVPDRWLMQPGDPVSAIAEARGPIRWDDWSEVAGPIAAFIRDELGVRSTVGTLIVVDGQLWGALAVHSKQPLPQDSESRMGQFSELVATAIGNAEARAEAARLANEQGALRRVATLVANEVSPADVFAKVAEEAATLLGSVHCALLRDEGDGTATVVGASAAAISDPFTPGARVPVNSNDVVAAVLHKSRPYRIDNYCAAEGGAHHDGQHDGEIKSAAGCPILVRGNLWGALVVTTARDSCPPDTERRLAQFADLVATAVGNADARAEIKRLADEQAALRRAATLVAQGARPAEVFAAVSEDVGRLFGSDICAVFRFDTDRPALVVVGASRGLRPTIHVGTRLGIDEPLAAAKVYRTGRSARFGPRDRASLSSTLADAVGRSRVVSTVASPIIVEGRRWGAVTVASTVNPLPFDAGERLERFCELVATAIANTDSRAQLAASRKRIVAASDEARRRIERDLHDGTQQRLVSLKLAARDALTDVPPEHSELRSELSRIASGLDSAVAELQEISRGIHPAILTQGGLAMALRTLARRSAIPVELEVATDARLPEPIEVAAYYAASEALANAAKHARASRVDISLRQRGDRLLLDIRDDGVGGADRARGSGLLGLSDRVAALGGSIRIRSQPGNGTSITVELPNEPDA